MSIKFNPENTIPEIYMGISNNVQKISCKIGSWTEIILNNAIIANSQQLDRQTILQAQDKLASLNRDITEMRLEVAKLEGVKNGLEQLKGPGFSISEDSPFFQNLKMYHDFINMIIKSSDDSVEGLKQSLTAMEGTAATVIELWAKQL